MKYINEIPLTLILISLVCYIAFRMIYITVTKKKLKLGQEAAIIILIAYMESLLYLTLFPSANMTPDVVAINLVPLKTISLYINFQGDISLQIINLVGNIVVFMPIGTFSLFFIKNTSFYQVFVIGFCSTLFIEMMQLFLSINGVISRSFDVDDLLLNTIGVILGYYIGLMIKRILISPSY